jgi:hypothetical protein
VFKDVKKMNFVLEVIFWILVIYGFLSLVQDIFYEVTYKIINHDLKIYVMVKNVGKNMAGFLTKIKKLKMENLYQQIIVIDLDSDVEIEKFENRLKEEGVDVALINKVKAKKFMDDSFQNENLSL